MQHFSFEFRDPSYDVAGWKLGAQVITFENTYGLDPDRTRVEDGTIVCGGLRWAGGQEQCAGEVAVSTAGEVDALRLTVSARHERKIRCTKIILTGLPDGRLIGARLDEHDIPHAGTILGWPRGGLPFPVVFLKAPGGGWLYFRSLDDRVREKRIAVYRAGDGTVTVELIHEDAGHEMTNVTSAPPWEIGRCDDPQTIIDSQMVHAERAFGLQPWETRPDVPDWAREISFVASIHMMHWSGHVFNTYQDALDVLRWVCERIEGRRVFAFLPGWEGRYYWQYGHYRPHARLGGEEGFRRLVEGAHELGARVCPMYGCNCANTGLENFEQWGAGSWMTSAGGWRYQGNKPDWDVSRAHDCGWQAWLNPGAPGWGSRLFEESARIVEQFGVDATFYDTCGCWANAPDHPVYEGMARLRDRLKERFPELLVTGEHWYSPLGAIFPVTHHWCPDSFPETFAKYNRRWAHLNTGDPSRGSTGVHEMGTNPWEMPELRRDLWPTVTFVDGTIAAAPDRVEQVIELAQAYSREYLQ
ncbi:MAG: hypothetical protein ACOX9R_01430 [Armatimonadota bacterium]|jgi:hypothetical protein